MAQTSASTRKSLVPQDSGAELVSRFREASEKFCGMLAGHGIPYRPYESPELPHFSKLPPELQSAALGSIEETLAICAELETAGESALNSKRFLWRTLSRLKMAPRSDVLDRIEDGDVVELYMPNYVQVFRNLNFFRYFSCTLEELSSLPVWQLAAFPPEVLQYFDTVVRDLVSGKITETFVPEIGPYVIEETVGAEKLRLEITLKQFSPVQAQGQGVAMVTINNSRIISRGASTDVPGSSRSAHAAGA